MKDHPPLTAGDDHGKFPLAVKIKPCSAARLDTIGQEWGISDAGVLAGLLLDELLSDTGSETLVANQIVDSPG